MAPAPAPGKPALSPKQKDGKTTAAIAELPPAPASAEPPPEPAPAAPEPKAEPPKVVVVQEVTPVSAGNAAGRGFDPVAAHAALDAVAPATCWQTGTAHGYGRARVTFGEGGAVKMVEIANPVQGAAPDTDCIARKYAAASVPPFHGANVTAYTTFFVN